MASETSVVTPERFASGFTYQEYLDQIKVNKNWFQQLYADFQLTSEEADFFTAATAHPQGPTMLLVLGEDWCPDVYRGDADDGPHRRGRRMEMAHFPKGPRTWTS